MENNSLEAAYVEMMRKQKRRLKEIDILEKRIDTFNKITWFFVVIGFVIVAFGCYQYSNTANVENAFKLNELGDFFAGSVASAWSLAGLLFIYVAFLGQKQQMIYQQIELSNNHYEIQVTREDIKNQTDQLGGQKRQLEIQNQNSKIQQFETTFFNLFNTYNQICSSMSHSIQGLRGNTIIFTGKKVLTEYVLDFNRILSETIERKDKTKESIDLESVQLCYLRFFESNRINLSQFFSSIESILLHIQSYYPDQRDNFFAQVLKNQFLEQELVLLFYHGIGLGNDKTIKSLIESFDVLNRIAILNTRAYSLLKNYQSIKYKDDDYMESENKYGSEIA